MYEGTVPAVLVSIANFQSTINIVTPGIYLFTYALQIYGTVNPTQFYTSIIGTNSNATVIGISFININNTSSSGSQTVICTASSYGLRVTYSGGTDLSVSSGFFTAVRVG